jgi:hypothetical protein
LFAEGLPSLVTLGLLYLLLRKIPSTLSNAMGKFPGGSGGMRNPFDIGKSTSVAADKEKVRN